MKRISVLLISFVLAVVAVPANAETRTVMVKDIVPDGGSSNPAELTDVNGTLFFRARDGAHGMELWKSDGTEEGTTLVKDIAAEHSDPYELTDVNGTLFFNANDGIHGEELWKSDGTEEGTTLVKDINTSGGSYPLQLTNVGGTLFFDVTNYEGTECQLWKSDGTADGTTMVANLWTSCPDFLTASNGQLYFRADDGTNGPELWTSDGSVEGTSMVKDLNPSGSGNPMDLKDVAGTLYFEGSDGETGFELWKSDGTAEGTALVKDINQGGGDSSPWFSYEVTRVNGTIFFRADNGTDGVGLWKSDGTAEGTTMVKPLFPVWLTNLNGTLFFGGFDEAHGGELWSSDGTTEGTTMVKDIAPGPSGCDEDFQCWGSGDPRELTEVGGTLFFVANDDAKDENGALYGHDAELWRSDGTADGTVMVKDIDPGTGGSPPTGLTNVDGDLFFTANDGLNGADAGHGRELWAVIEPKPEADLVVAKSDSADPIEVGQVLTYGIDVTNKGPDPATSVKVQDTLPASVQFLTANASQGTCGQESGTVTCDLGSLALATASVTITVKPTAAGSITNSVTV